MRFLYSFTLLLFFLPMTLLYVIFFLSNTSTYVYIYYYFHNQSKVGCTRTSIPLYILSKRHYALRPITHNIKYAKTFVNEHNLKIPHLHTPIDVETLQCTSLPSLKLTLNFTQPSYSTDVHVGYRLSARKLRLDCRVQIPVEVIAFVGAQIPLKCGWTYLFSPIWKLIATSLGKIGSACCLATQLSKNLFITKTTATKPSVFKLSLYTLQGDYSINNIKNKKLFTIQIFKHIS